MKLCENCQNQEEGFFPITSVHRDDILYIYKPVQGASKKEIELYEKVKKKVESMTDDDMKEFASNMADAYMNVFGEDLKQIFEDRWLNEEG